MTKVNPAYLLGTALLATAFSMNSSAAITTGWGVEASTSTASNCPSYCTTAGGGDFAYDSMGAEFSTSASAEENSYGHAKAYASLAGSSYLPTLKIETSANVGKGGSATAFAAQGFTYTGADSSTITLDINLHGSVGSEQNGSYSSNSLRGDVAVFIGSGLEWYPSFATLVYEIAYGAPVTEAGLESLFISSGNDVNTGTSISFDLNAGDTFYVISSMGASSKNGFVDGWNTMTMSFDDDSQLQAVSQVPVPAAAWLFGSALLGLASIGRQRNMQS